jgi:LacI family transcriptional regulator
MPKKKVTIIDIAKKLNLSKSTVSRALQDHPRISEKTRKVVKAMARKLDFEPNTLAISLFTKKSNIIGVIVPEIVNHFFAAVIDGIEDIAYKAGYKVLISKSNESYQREVASVSALVGQHVDGLLVSLSKETKKTEHLHTILKKGIPLVFFDRVSERMDVTKVVVDDFKGSFKATEFLINSGYKKIAHLAGPSNLSIGRLRKNGYIRALNMYTLPIRKEHIITVAMDLNGGYKGAQALLAMKDRPDAIFAANDQIALGAMKAIKEHNLRIPKDVALMGFSNEPMTEITEPALTTIHQPAFEMGQTACDLLIKEIKSKTKKGLTQKIVLKTTLKRRDST